MKLDNQTVIITGGASGLGAAIVERFIDEGANIGVLDRSIEGCGQLREQYGEKIVCVAGDVRQFDDNEKIVSECVSTFGKLDCVIGNAGIWDYNMALVDMPAGDLSASFRELFDINVLGYMMLSKAALKPLAASEGSMIFTVSNAGFWPSGGGMLYTATKHAVAGMIKQLAFELAPYIRVNGVAPGAISTQLKGPESLGMGDAQFPGEQMSATAKDFVPVGAMPTPAEYAGAYVFFASREDNVPSTGAILNHDGGFGIRGLGPVPRGGDDLLSKL
ncbi:MAG: NAD(P)-dependent dehydrogenase (short-subunit alcohol dehydrogenase family) [Limisphaerales bacterium]|jgi:NAD(P)-dependent dehydrogenase (short-subunit alcohol dehydrogenase family)